MPNYYDVGDVVRTSSTFTDTGGVKADPTTVHYVLTTPDGTDIENTRTSTDTGPIDTINRVSTGVYFRDITIGTSSGPYWYRFSSTGVITSAAEANFRVRRQYTAT